jgi:hypothetical protein
MEAPYPSFILQGRISIIKLGRIQILKGRGNAKLLPIPRATLGGEAFRDERNRVTLDPKWPSRECTSVSFLFTNPRTHIAFSLSFQGYLLCCYENPMHRERERERERESLQRRFPINNSTLLKFLSDLAESSCITSCIDAHTLSRV